MLRFPSGDRSFFRLRRFLILILVLCACRGRETPQRVYESAPVVIISIDTLRADRLPMFGYEGVQTPHLDALRAESILYRKAYAHVPLTLPSHVALLTGKLPAENKVRNNIGYVLDPSMPTIPRLLKEHGYETGAAISAYVLRGGTGLRQHFDFYEDAISNRGNLAMGQVQRPGMITARLASDWIAARAQRPFFFLLHVFEPHAPYEPTYEADIAAADRVVGAFIASLKSLGVYDRAIVIVLSDHGEGLGDHGEPEHGIFVYREAIHVPLLLKLPGGVRGTETVEEPVGLIDVFPTIAALTGVEEPALAGRSLLGPRDASRRIYAESFYPRIHLGWSELRSLVGAQYQFIEAPRPELFDIVRDAAEKTNLVSEERRTYAAMRDELRRYESAIEAPGRIDPEEAKKLAALGYLSSTPAAAAGPLPDPKDRIGEIAAMGRASALLRSRRYGEAAAAFRAIIDANPRLTDAWNELGTTLELAGELEEAAEVYRRAIASAPELAGEFGLRLASVLLKLERYDDAEKHARLAEKTHPSAMHLQLSRVAYARKDYRRVEAEARAAATDPSERNGAELILAQSWAQQGKVVEALHLVDTIGSRLAAEGAGQVERYDFVRGDILARMERYDQAIGAFRREIEAFPDYRQTYANLYLVLMVTGRDAEADSVLEEMVEAAGARKGAMEFAARTAAAVGDDATAAAWKRRAAGAE